jgi:GWxTD domain-containing protein
MLHGFPGRIGNRRGLEERPRLERDGKEYDERESRFAHAILPVAFDMLTSLFLPGLLGVLLAAGDEREDKLPEPYRTWLREEVTYIISPVEREAFLSLTTEAERQSFLEVFWRKRDLNPSTPENEYRSEHYERLAYANEFFGRETFRPGWQTDRGRYYILLGKPGTRRPLEASDEIYPSELWFYNNPELKYLGLPPFFHLLFFRRAGSGELELYSPLSDGPQALLTGFQAPVNDFRDDVERAYEKLFAVDVELAQASLSFRTDEGDKAQFQNPAFGTLALLDDIASAPFRRLDTSYAERLDFERGNVESDYLFTYVPSFGLAHVLPGPERTHYLHWVIELDPENVGFVRDEDRGTYNSVFVASVEIAPADDDTRLALEERKESFIELTERQAGGSLKLPFAYAGMSPVVPGAFKARVILRNRACPSRAEADCFKSYTLFDTSFSVPEWQNGAPELSELVLSYGSEVVDGDPLYRPFRFGKVEVFPNPRAVYAIGDPLVAAVEPRNAPPGSRVRFEVTGGEPAPTIRVEKTVDVAQLEAGPMIQELSLQGFEGGRFELGATLLDSEGRELSRRSAPFTVSPRTAIVRPGVRGSLAPPRPEVPGVVPMILGEQHLRLGDKDEAREELELALRLNPQLGPAREHLAGLLLEAGEADAALAVLQPLIQNVPERFEVLVLLGKSHFERREYPQAVERIEKAITLRRPDPALLNLLARAHHELGNDARAKEILERSLELNPEQPPVRDLLEQLKAGADGPR